MRRHIRDRGNAMKRGASTILTAGQPRKNVIAMSMTNTRQPRPCISVSSDLARTRASARVIASNTWRRHMAGRTFDQRTMANPRRIRAARHHRLLRPQLQSLTLRAQSMERHQAPTTTAVDTASHHRSTAPRTHCRTRPSTAPSCTLTRGFRRLEPASTGTNRTMASPRAALHHTHRLLIDYPSTQGL